MNKALIKKDLSLEEKVDLETNDRAVLTKFITSHMKDKTDFGSIMIGGRASKPSLFKAGAEKIASLLKLRAEVVKDTDTWEMAGSKAGVFCYKCYLYPLGSKEWVGMGLGACTLEEKKSYNNAIKIAKKRAFVDAILTTGALSDFFTQDLEDIDHEPKEGQKQALPPVKSPTQVFTEKVEKPIEPLISSTQKMDILELMSKKGKSQKELDAVVASRKKEFLKDLTTKEAEAVIKKLESLPDKKI